MSRYNCPLDCKVYVGGLTRNASREEIERIFSHYGKLNNVFVARNPPGFAFVEFEDTQDASDAVRALDGRVICGVRARVELSHGKSRKSSFRRHEYARSRTPERRKRSYSRSRSTSRSRTDHRDRRERKRERFINERSSPRKSSNNTSSTNGKTTSKSRSRSRS